MGAIHRSVLVNKRWTSNQEKASHSNNQGNYLFRRGFPDQKRSRTGGLISLLGQSPRSRCYWDQQDHCCVAGQSDLACCKKMTAYCKYVLQAKRVAPSPLNCLMQEYDLSWVKAVKLWVTNEAETIKAFINLTGKTVYETRIWLDSSEILGASPDGIPDRAAVWEARCP